MILVLLTDNDNNTCQVACPDVETADSVAAAAIFSDGGVSAWRVPPMAVTDTDTVIEQLRRGEDCADLLNAHPVSTYVDIREHEYTKCAGCHLFVEPNSGHEPGADVAPWVHLHRGDEADEALDASHEAVPSDQTYPLSWWREHGPDEMKARFTS